MKEKLKEYRKRKGFMFFLIFSFFIFLIIFFGARLYLIFNFLIGNDTIVKLDSSDQEIFLNNSESKKIDFQAYISTNFFCTAHCDYNLDDLSEGTLITQGEFNTKLANPKTLSYILVAPTNKEGQKLYHFDLECYSEKSFLCRTSGEISKKTYLVVMNYKESEDQKILKFKSLELFNETISNYNKIILFQNENREMYKILEDKILIENLTLENFSFFQEELNFLKEKWELYDYRSILDSNLFKKIEDKKNNLSLINGNLNSTIERYNYLIFNLTEIKSNLNLLIQEENISLENYTSIENLISEYNNLTLDLENKFNLSSKEIEIKIILEKINSTFQSLDKNFNNTYSYSEIKNFNLTTLNKPEVTLVPFEENFFPQKEVCCYKGECKDCCDEECRYKKELYPIILVHGHSFNEKISADARLSDFDNVKDALAQEGIIDGGYVILDSLDNPGIFSKVNQRMVFSVSYYFDIYQDEKETFNLQSKAESLDTYALRLNDIIENVKIMTNREKVNIVSHSMGGLVSRKYLQVFGEESTQALIMLGTPNNGIDGYVRTACPILGADVHCEMMDKDSLFINKLNSGKIPSINVSVVSGIGCNTDGADGDGIVKNESAYLPWAKMHYVNGNCNGVNFFHIDMRDMQKYPEIYKIIKDELGI